jgi:C-terminal processing protease CtpA/Prc
MTRTLAIRYTTPMLRSNRFGTPVHFVIPSAIAVLALLGTRGEAQPFDKYQRDRGVAMLHDVVDALRKHYYDPAFHGVDLAAELKTAEHSIQSANSNTEVFGAIAGLLYQLNDSHTFFQPPPRATRRQFGYVMSMVGDDCFITNVRPGSDASEKLAPGDKVISIQGFTPARANFWLLSYALGTLGSTPVVRLAIGQPDGSRKTVDVSARVHQEKRVLDLTEPGEDFWRLVRDDENAEHLTRQRFSEFGDALIVWKMPQFDMTAEQTEADLKVAKRHQTLILDLRGNPGGLVTTLEYLVGGVMDHDVTIAQRKGRKADLKPQVAKKHPSPFQGKLIVLVDSRSASAAELFARTVQLEHRGIVLGDLSSGSVMESRHYPGSQGLDTKIFYATSITDADLIMSDGKSLEHIGVMPDERILPTAADLAAARDPVLARAAQLAGVELDPAAAGKLFAYEWREN